MRLPEFLFGIINFIVKTLLRSPLHGFMSSSIMIIGFIGRKSGRYFETPVRFMTEGETIICFSETNTQWWRNLQSGQGKLTIKRETADYDAEVTVAEPEVIRPFLLRCLDEFPQDAPYHSVKLDKNKKPLPEDLETALAQAVMVKFRRRQ